MSSSEPPARPTQVTVAGWSVAIASAFLLVSVFDALGSLHSVATRDQIAQAIDSGNLKGLGISVAEVLDVKRWALYVTAVSAVVTGILGAFALQRDKAARIGLTLAAVPIVLAVPLTESFLAMLVGAGTVVMWSRPARDWFAGRPISPREPRPVAARPDVPPPPRPDVPDPWIPPAAEGHLGEPAPFAGWGAVPGAASWGSQQPVAPAVSPRPRQVRIACVATWILSGITALGYLAVLVVISIDQQSLIDRVKENPSWDSSYDDNLIVTAAVAGSIIFLLWCAVVSVVAVFTWRGATWAWIVHLISTGVAGLVTVVALPLGLIPLAVLGWVFGMLLSRPARNWFTSRRP